MLNFRIKWLITLLEKGKLNVMKSVGLSFNPCTLNMFHARFENECMYTCNKISKPRTEFSVLGTEFRLHEPITFSYVNVYWEGMTQCDDSVEPT